MESLVEQESELEARILNCKEQVGDLLSVPMIIVC